MTSEDAARGEAPVADLLFTNATVCDGTGAPARQAHVVVSGRRIDMVLAADAPVPAARRTVESGGLVLAPGFIDVHSHSDYTALVPPYSASKISQGITTEIVGNCGFSAFPLRGCLLDDERALHPTPAIDWTWSSAEDYFAKLAEAQPAVNIASFVGHRNLRACAMGFADRRPTHAEMDAMVRDLEAALEAGAIGWSTGLIYVPGLFAATDELVALGRAAARSGGLYASHVRGEGDRLLSAAAEFFEIVDGSGGAAQYSHLKASGRRNWGKVNKVISQLEQRVAAGAQLAFDRYPYTASSTELSSLLPRWVVDGGRDEALRRLASGAVRSQIAEELEADFAGDPPWNDILLAGIHDDMFAKYQGWRLAAIAAALSVPPMELFFELLRAGRLDVWMCHFTMSEADMERVLTHPLCMVCTDAESQPTTMPAEGAPHPRGFGAFPRFVQHFVREHHLLSIEEAVRKMTALPAEMFGLDDRGRIAPGFAADLVLFDAATLADCCEYGQAPRCAEGVQMVVVNGTVTWEAGALTQARAGQVLRREKG
jgi:N-acyl-D-amino-acid deacylase